MTNFPRKYSSLPNHSIPSAVLHGMPAIQSFINNYKSGWKAKSVISSLRFNRNDSSSSTIIPDDPRISHSRTVSAVLDIKDDSSMDFDGGRPDEYENDVVDKSSEPGSSRPSNVSSSTSPPERLEVTLPPELRIDWLAEKFAGMPSNPRKSRVDARVDSLDQHTRDTLAGKPKEDQGLVQTLGDALALHVDSNPSRYMSISGLDFLLPGVSPTDSFSPTPLTIPNSPSDPGHSKYPRDSITMLTSRLSLGDTPASSALSGTTLARALISNTFAMPIDRLPGEGGLTRADSSVLPRDCVHNMFSIAPDAPPMPPDAETLYVAPKRPRSERRKQIKRRSSTGTLDARTLPDLPSRRTSLILSMGPEFATFLKSPRPWSSDTAPESSPSTSSPRIVESPTPPIHRKESTKNDDSDFFTLPPLPEGVRRLPCPGSSSSAGVSPSISTQSSTSKDLDTKGLEDVLDYYNLGESPSSFAGFRPGFSPIREETGSQSSTSSPFRSDRRDSKRMPPVGARSPRSRGDSMQLASRPSDQRLSKLLMLLPSQNDSSGGLSENSGSLKSRPSFEPQRSDSASSYSQDIRNSGLTQRTQSIVFQTSSSVETSPAEDSQRSNGDDSSLSVADDTGSAIIDRNYSSGRVSQSEGNYGSNSSMINLNINPPIHQPGPGTGFAAPSTSTTNLPVSPLLVRKNSLPADEATIPPTLVNSTGTTTVSSPNVQPVNGSNNSTWRTDEKSVFSHRPTGSEPMVSQHHHLYKDDFLGRNSTLSMGSPPPYYEVVNQAHPGPSTLNGSLVGPSDPVAGPSRLSGEWSTNDSRRASPARTLRVRPRPPLPIGPRRPSQGVVPLPSSMALSESFNRSASMGSLTQQAGLSRQRSARLPIIPSPKFQIPPPKWRGHTMDAARWTFKSSQLQAIVTTAIKQSSEASLIRLLEPEILENDIAAEIADLETLRTDIKTRYKLLARRRAVLFEALSSFLGNHNTEDGLGYAHRLLEDLSEIAATLDHLSEELHSADAQLAHLDSLTQVHTSSALAVALRKLNTSFLKQMSENENLRNELLAVETERGEAWLEAERIAIELDELAVAAENPSPIATSNRSSRVSAHRKSTALASKVGLKGLNRQPSVKVPPLITGPFVSRSLSSKGTRSGKQVSPPTSVDKKLVPISTDSATLNTPLVVYSPSTATKALMQAQEEVYTMLGLSVPATSLQRSRSWRSATSSPQDSISASHRHSTFLSNEQPLSNNNNNALAERRSSLPTDSTLAQVSNAMAADRRAMLVTFDMLSARDTGVPSR